MVKYHHPCWGSQACQGWTMGVFGVSFADRMKHPPALEWKMSHFGLWRGTGAALEPGQHPWQPQLSSALPWAAPPVTALVHIPSPCHTAGLQKTNQQQSLLWFKLNPSQTNDTMEEKQQHRQGQVSLATLGRTSGKLVTCRQRGSHKAQWGQCSP